MKTKEFLLVFVLLLTACTQSPTTESVTPIATAPPEAPATATDTVPTSTITPLPTALSQLTPTPFFTDTPEPLPTDTPEPLPSVVATSETAVSIQSRLTLFSEMPVIEREAGNKYLNGGAVIFHDGQFHMFSNFFNSWPGATTTYYYTSADGQTWTRNIEDPLFTINDVPLAGTGALVLTGLVQPDGTWVLYYHTFTSNASKGFIGRITAPSPTGPWTFDEEPALSPGSDGEWDDTQVMRVNVLPHEDGYVMYYAGVTRGGNSRIGMATSADNISWEKYDDPNTTEAPYAESDPIMEPEFDWEGRWLGRPEVVKTNDGWVMLYEGGQFGSQSGLAISQDGINFVRYDANPILTRDNMVEGYRFFQGAFFHENDTYYYLIEAGNGPTGTDIFLYTLEGSLLAGDSSESNVSPSASLNFDFTLQRGRDNPALEDGNSGDFDSSWTFAPGVIHHNDQFHMFFTGWNSGAVIRIGYAVSDNGLDFERVTDDFVLEWQPDNPDIGIWTPVPLVLDDGTWVLFVGENRNQRSTNRILRATAPAPEGPWTWDDEPIYTADLDGWDAKLLPESVTQTPDGGYIMTYESNWCTNTQVGVLLSDDGVNWQPYNDPTTNEDGLSGSDPVLSPTGNEEDWDRQALSSPLIFATDTGYELFYIGQFNNIGTTMSKFNDSWLGYATSSDGVSWVRYDDNPVIELTGEDGCPWMSGVKVDDTYYFYLALSQGQFGIGVITGTITDVSNP